MAAAAPNNKDKWEPWMEDEFQPWARAGVRRRDAEATRVRRTREPYDVHSKDSTSTRGRYATPNGDAARFRVEGWVART